jgi:hypothetical protein
MMCYPKTMRTTLELDDDILDSVRPLAHQRGVTLGRLISELARQSLTSPMPQKVRNGVLLFTPQGGNPRPDLRLVNELRDSD